MKAFLDTSLLVNAFYPDFEHHEASFAVIARHEKKEICCASHSLLEVYATLTRMPGKRRISPELAMLYLHSIEEKCKVVALTPEETLKTLQTYADLGVSGGTIYDAHLASCALKAQAKIIYTWNTKHFLQFGPKIASLVRSPAA